MYMSDKLMRIIERILFVCVILVTISIVFNITAGVSNSQEHERSAESFSSDDPLSNRSMNIMINDQPVYVNTTYFEVPVEAPQLHVGDKIPVKIELEENSDPFPEDTKISINGKKLERKGNDFEGEFSLKRLDNDSSIVVRISGSGSEREYVIRTLPERLPEVTFEGNNRFDKGMYYYTNFYADPLKKKNNYLVKYDHTGNIVFYRQDLVDELVNFTRFSTDDGFSGYYYFQQNDDGLELNHQSFRRGEYVILDDNYHEIDRIVPQKTDIYTQHPGKTEIHDFQVLGKDHYLIFDSVPVDNGDGTGKTKQETYLQELNNGEVVWEWFSNDEPYFSEAKNDPRDRGGRLQNISEDNIHTNSVIVDPSDGNIVISNRNLNSVVKINKETKGIEWIFGGDENQFDYNGMKPFEKQHHAHYGSDGKMYIYDNNTFGDISRGLVIDLDEKNKKVLSYKEYTHENQKGNFTGTFHELGSNSRYLLAGWGMDRTQNDLLATVFTREGKPLKHIKVDRIVNNYRIIADDR